MQEQPHSTPNNLVLKEINAESYGGIHEGESLVVIFPEDKNIAVFEGDQGTNKSSTMSAIREILTGDVASNAINSIDGTKKVEGTIVDNETGNEWIVRSTKTGFNVTMKMKDGTTTKVLKPKEFLRDKVGSLGLDPHFLKNMDTAEQLAWLEKFANLSKEQSDVKKLITSNEAKARTARKNINRDLKQKRAILTASGLFYYKDKELLKKEQFAKDEAYYTQSLEERQRQVTQAVDGAQIFVSKRDQVAASINNSVSNLSLIDGQIIELEKKIQVLRSQKKDTEEHIKVSKEFLELPEYQNCDDVLLKAKEAQAKMNEYFVGKSGFDKLVATEKEYEALEEDWKLQDGKIAEYESVAQEFVKSITPAIEGIEICVPKDIDVVEETEIYKELNPDATEEQIKAYVMGLENEKREGIYYKGHPIKELCESELWELCTKIWGISGTRVIFIENISSLGTDAIESINAFANAGGRVYATLMKRGAQKISWTFLDKING